MRRLLTCWTSVAVGAGMGLAAAGQCDGGLTIHATTTKTETATPSLPDVDLKVAPPAAHAATSSPIATGPDGPASPLRLQLVLAVTRHGLRTPLSSTDQRNEWRCEHDQLLVQHYADADDALRLTHSDEPLPDHVPANLLTRRKLLHGRQKLRGNCHVGQLTHLGLEQLRRIGELLRERYVDELRVLPPVFDARTVFVRSTDTNRTIESAQSLLWGLYPPSTRPHGREGVMDVNIVEGAAENMYPRSACARLNQLKKDARATPDYLKHREDRQPFQDKVEAALGRKVNSWDGLNSTLQTIIRHRLLLPDGVDQDIVDGVESEAGYETAVKFSSPEICRLAIGRFIGDVVDRVQTTVDGEDDVRFALYSGHDNTLSPFLSAFNVFDARQPPMASVIVLEVYKDAKDKHWVRFLYNGEEMVVQAPAKGAGAEKGELEPLTQRYPVAVVRDAGEAGERREAIALAPHERWRELATSLIPIDYDAECKESAPLA